MKFSQREKLILGLLVIVVVGLFILGFGLIYFTYVPQLVLYDTEEPVITTGIVSEYPTYTSYSSRVPTSTIIFTPVTTQSPDLLYTPYILTIPTKLIVPSLTPITNVQFSSPIPNPQQTPPQQNPTQQIVKDCSPQLNYAKSVHQYNLAIIDSTYKPQITYYESLLDQALRDRDAIAVLQYQRQLDSIRKQYNAAVKAENQRYESEIAYIKSTCK